MCQRPAFAPKTKLYKFVFFVVVEKIKEILQIHWMNLYNFLSCSFQKKNDGLPNGNFSIKYSFCACSKCETAIASIKDFRDSQRQFSPFSLTEECLIFSNAAI